MSGEADPNARRMLSVIICWYCFIGKHDRCAYWGPLPRGDDDSNSGILTDCMCARGKHRGESWGESTQQYNLAGEPINRGSSL